jgi:hypothetical protein
MKKIIYFVTSLALSGIVMTTYAQSQQQTTPTPRPIQSTGTIGQTPQLVTDPMISDRLARDLTTRNAATQTQTINWYQTNYGYTGNYAIGSANYMARYDQQGNYVETLRRSEWNKTTVPTTLVNAYGQSPFKNHEVTGYWSVTDPGKSGYFLELRDKNGTASTIWADSQGKFTTAPYSSTIPPPNN